MSSSHNVLSPSRIAVYIIHIYEYVTFENLETRASLDQQLAQLLKPPEGGAVKRCLQATVSCVGINACMLHIIQYTIYKIYISLICMYTMETPKAAGWRSVCRRQFRALEWTPTCYTSCNFTYTILYIIYCIWYIHYIVHHIFDSFGLNIIYIINYMIIIMGSAPMSTWSTLYIIHYVLYYIMH